MAALTKNKDVPHKEGVIESYLVKANTRVFKGALVAVDADGWLLPAAGAASLSVVGKAIEEANNLGGTDGAIGCRVLQGVVVKVVATSITQAMLGEMMYIVDDQTVDDTRGTYGIKAGILVEYETATSGWIMLSKSAGQAVMTADADATYGQPEADLINEMKAIINKYLK